MNEVFFVPWIPRRLSKVIGRYWTPTGKWGWFTPTFKVVTFWREVYYVSPEDLFAMEYFKRNTTKPAMHAVDDGA